MQNMHKVQHAARAHCADSEIVMVDLAFGDNFFDQNGHGTTLGRPFQHLGHPPKFYRVQNAGFSDGSTSWWQINVILKKTLWQITTRHVFSPKWHYWWQKNKEHQAGMLVTESPDWDAPKPSFSIKTNKQLEKSGNQGQINHRNWSLFLSLRGGEVEG